MRTNTLDFDAQALRERILDLAMRGKLVPQDPNDEPASVLLKKIKAKKEELVKEKKIKKSKALPAITDDEKPFNIPDSWEWVRLGDITAPVEYAMADGPFGSNLKKSDYTLEPEVRIIQLSNIGDQGWKDENVKYTTFKHLKDIERSEVFPGNIVIAKMMPAGRAIIVPDKDKKYVLSSDAVKFIPNKRVYKKFLLYAINSNTYRDQVNSKLQGSTRPRTSLKKLKNFMIPLPPLSEQSRIAAKIAQLFALLRKVETSTQQYAELQTLLKFKVLDLAMRGKLVKQDPNDEPASVLLEKIKAEKAELVKEKKIKKSKPLPPITDEEKPFDIPDSWKWVRLGNVYQFVDYRGKTPHKISSGIRLITAKNVRNGHIKLEPEEFISKEEYNERNTRGLINKGDIFITTEAPMGLVALNNFDEPIATAQRLITLQKVSKYQDTSFDAFQMQSSFFQKELCQKATGTTVKGIKAANLKQTLILVPPLVERKKIKEKIKQIFDILK